MHTIIFDRDREVIADASHRDGTIEDMTITPQGREALEQNWKEWQSEGIPITREQAEPDRFVMFIEHITLDDPHAKDALWQWSRQHGFLPLELQDYHLPVWTRLVSLSIKPIERYQFAVALHVTPKDAVEEWNKSLDEIL